MSLLAHESAEQIHELTELEDWEMFDRAARFYLGISGKEFLERWHAGVYRDLDAEPRAMRVSMLMPIPD